MANAKLTTELNFIKVALRDGMIDRDDAVHCLRVWNSDKQKSPRKLLINRCGLKTIDVNRLDQLTRIEADNERNADAPANNETRTLDLLNSGKEIEDSDLFRFLDSFIVGNGILAASRERENPMVKSSFMHDKTSDHGYSGQNLVDATVDVKPVEVGATIKTAARFEIKKSHARGGLGEVFVALDQELDREVALKQIRPRFADDLGARERFESEACITGGLEHPGIVPVYGFGKHSDGRPFYAMRFIRGNTLKDVVIQLHENGRSKNEQAFYDVKFYELLERFNDACHAIAYAHSRGVIHRDIKPSNIMLGKFGETLVVDWGLAKSVGRKDQYAEMDASTLMPFSGSHASATIHGSTIGTPPFMSPEQAEGELELLGPKSDIYSLGATLYMILTGLPPYKTIKGKDILDAVKKGNFEHPIVKNKHIPKPLNAICVKAMSFNPDDRYATSQELASDVQRWIADQPVTAYTDPMSVRATRWIRHHKTAAISSALAVVTIAVASLVGALMLNAEKNKTLAALADLEKQQALTLEEKGKTELALNAETRARQQTQSLLNSVSNDLVTDVLAESSELTLSQRSFLTSLLGQFQQFAKTGSEQKIEPQILADGYVRIANIQRRLGDIQPSLESCRQGISTYETVLANTEPVSTARVPSKIGLAEAHAIEGALLLTQKDLDGADKAYRAAQVQLTELAESNPDEPTYRFDLANVLVNKATVLQNKGKAVDADLAYSRAIDMYDSLDEDAMSGRNILLSKTQALANYAGILARKPEGNCESRWDLSTMFIRFQVAGRAK